MVPLNCCQGCKYLNDDGIMKNKLRCLLGCEKYENELTMKLYKQQAPNKGCSTCKNCIRVMNLPGFVTGEECECTAGLECDTVLFSVKNCPRWVGQYEEE